MSEAALKTLKVVRAKRLYEQVAEQIEALIRDQQLPAGSKLPSEREFAEQLGVSRPSLREAMIALETLGLVEVKVGDGTFVATRLPIRSDFSLVVDADLGPGLHEQFEARRAVEVTCAALAARRATPEQIDELEQSVVRMAGQIEAAVNPMDSHRQFHECLARASGNMIFEKAVSDLWDLRHQPMWDLLRQKVEHPESWAAGLAFRRKLVEAIRRRDEVAARTAMEEHFNRVGTMYFG